MAIKKRVNKKKKTIFLKKSVRNDKRKPEERFKPRRKEKGNILTRNFIRSINYLRESRNYIWIASLIFLLAGLIGFFFPVFFVNEIRTLVQELVKQTEGLDAFGLIKFIILNNMQSAFIGLISGIFFGLIPLGIILVNGYVLGFVANKSAAVEGILVLWRLMPHGVFELPAIMISVGLGIKLGMFIFTYRGKDKMREFFRWIMDSLRVFVFIVIPLLLIAGTIEGLLIWLIG